MAPRSARQRAADIKLMVGATVGVLLAGAFVAAALLVVSSDDAPECRTILAGEAVEVRDRLDSGPYFLSGGGQCSFWLALDEGDVVAYQVRQPAGCTLNREGGGFVCGGEPVDPADLAQYPVRIVTRDGLDSYVVDLAPSDGATSPDARVPSG